MAGVKISALPAAGAITGSELVPVVQSASTVQTTPAAIRTYALTSPTFTNYIGVNGVNPNYLISISGTLAVSTTTGGINFSSIIPNSTTTVYGLLSNPTTAASGTLNTFRGVQTGIALGGAFTVNNAFGFTADASIGANATNGYGFFHNIAAATNKWGFYGSGTAANYMAGSLGLGSTSLTGYTFRNLLPITGATTSYQSQSGGAIQSDVTSTAVYNSTTASTVAAAFTLGNLIHFQVNQGSIGAGSAVTSQFGFNVSSSMVGATNNYGYSLDYNELAGRWGLYFAGSAQNYINGAVGIGSTSVGLTSGIIFRVSRPLTGNVSTFGVLSDGTIQSDVTSNAVLYRSVAQTQAASFTLANLVHHQAAQGTFGAGSAVTAQSGFVADNTLIGAGSNYGFRGSIPSGTGRYNLYMDGTAQNFIQGNVGIGTGKTVPAFPLDVAGQIRGTYVGGVPANTLSAAGSDRATATGLAAQYNVVTGVSSGQGVRLPDVIGVPIWVFNNQASFALLIYPSTASQTINALGAGVGFSLAAAGKVELIQVATNVWYTMT